MFGGVFKMNYLFKMKIARHTIKQIAETKVSETLNLKELKTLFPSNWKEKLEELKKSKFKSVIFPK
jgi:hypothetical protein